MLSVRSLDDGAVARLARGLAVRDATARCLVARGHGEVERARAFLNPRLGELRRPEGEAGMAGFATAADRVAAAVLRRQRIAVFGDYDVDGVTTCALLTSFLRGCGGDVVARVARRDEGYGFTAIAAEELLAADPGLVITGDCGTSDGEVIAAVRARGVDVIVVDHHTVPAAGAVHPALALVNPHRADSSFPFRGMASVGIAFYLAAAIRTRLRAEGWFAGRPEVDPRDLLDLVALGTIADLVPLAGENRILAAAGLRLVAERRRPGLAALLAAAGVDAADARAVDEKTVAWKLAPRLNAPGRLGDAAPALELLLAGADEATARAQALEEVNQRRRALQDQMVEEALAAAGDAPGPAIVVASERWAPGVVGIVAAKLVDRFARPAFVIAVDPVTGVGRGSARRGRRRRSVPRAPPARAAARALAATPRPPASPCMPATPASARPRSIACASPWARRSWPRARARSRPAAPPTPRSAWPTSTTAWSTSSWRWARSGRTTRRRCWWRAASRSARAAASATVRTSSWSWAAGPPARCAARSPSGRARRIPGRARASTSPSRRCARPGRGRRGSSSRSSRSWRRRRGRGKHSA
ncbi:MAG: DHH family phosphoesterase [Kofleriaceae bacterium]|nr:DHH family phosphoesterase [Kofleriaceae bacterium]